jgi:hypothetical protein
METKGAWIICKLFIPTKKTCITWRGKKSHALLNCGQKGNVSTLTFTLSNGFLFHLPSSSYHRSIHSMICQLEKLRKLDNLWKYNSFEKIELRKFAYYLMWELRKMKKSSKFELRKYIREKLEKNGDNWKNMAFDMWVGTFNVEKHRKCYLG